MTDHGSRTKATPADTRRPRSAKMMHRKLPFCLAIGLALGWATLACNFPRASSTADIERTIEAISQTLVAAASMAPATAKPSPTPPAGLAGAGLPAQRPTPYPAHPGPAYAYDARAGDTLDGLAGRFGVAAGQITSDLPLPTQGHLPAGQRLWIPHVLGSTSAAEILLPDSELLYSPAASDFDVRDFVDRAGGHLSRYRETREDGAELDGATIVQRVSAELSVNPRLLLALLEVRSHWLYGGPPDAAQGENPFGFDIPERSGLYQETKIAATQLNLAFYGWRAGTFTEIRFSNGESLRLDPRLNAGSAALLHFFALFSEPDAWEESLYAPGGFPTRYEQMFGSPWARAAAVEPLLAPHLAQPVLELPFSPGERWSLTAGPHQAWNYGTPRGALDFSPITGGLPCDVSPAWAAASAPGVVVRAVDNAVALDLDGDGREGTGWVLVYFHLAQEGLVVAGTRVETGQPLGHPSCEGGRSTGKHVHLARKYNGEWLAADGPLPFVLSGWRVVADEREYSGALVNGVQVVRSDSSGRVGSTITR